MKFGFIGTGNMAGALVRALAKQSDSIALANRTPTKAETLAAEVGGVVWRNEEVAAQCQYIFLGVKPNLLESVLAPLAPILQTRPQDFVLVSMASGVTIAEVQAMAGGPYPVIRIMPNTPAAVGAGMILYCCSGNVTAAQRAEFLTAMQDAGAFDCLEEQLMDAGSAVSGCGPAFVYLFLEAMADGGVACGLPRSKAQQYAAQTVLGAARLLQQSKIAPSLGHWAPLLGACFLFCLPAICQRGFFPVGELLELPFAAHGFGLCGKCLIIAKLHRQTGPRVFCALARLMHPDTLWQVVCPASVIGAVAAAQ